MSRCTLKLCRVLICGLLGCCLPLGAAGAQEKPKAAAPPTQAGAPSPEQMMQMVEQMAALVPEHDLLKRMAGTWKTSMKSWMSPGDPIQSEGTSTATLVMGGRFLKEDFRGTFMDKPFEGSGLLGYDKVSKKYVGAWIDNLGTGILNHSGSMDAGGKVLTMTAGPMPDPMGGPDTEMRMVTTLIDDNSHKFEMYMKAGGEEMKSMEIMYSRVK